jgi:putative transposase
MKQKRYTDGQIAFGLRQAESDTAVAEICRKLGVSEPTFCRWEKQFAGMGTVVIRRLKQLEEGWTHCVQPPSSSGWSLI